MREAAALLTPIVVDELTLKDASNLLDYLPTPV
jgi:hypothetical protein